MKHLIPLLILLPACNWGPFKKDNEKQKVVASEILLSRIDNALRENYCPKAVAKYNDAKGRIHTCDSALFAGLLGVACDGVNIAPFENEAAPGQMCRTWECDCFLPESGTDNGSDSQYSKDMNAGIQLNMAVRRDQPELTSRIVSYIESNNGIICNAIDEITWAGKCILPPNSIQRWKDLKDNTETGFHEPPLLVAGFERHLAVLSALIEGEIYGKISDISLAKLKTHSQAEPNNVVYRAAYNLYRDGDMRAPAELWLEQCPLDQLPNNHDNWCTDYKYQRNEEGTDWATCPGEPFEEHPGVDCAFAAWIILHNKERS